MKFDNEIIIYLLTFTATLMGLTTIDKFTCKKE
jgi:hypothetical protein